MFQNSLLQHFAFYNINNSNNNNDVAFNTNFLPVHFGNSMQHSNSNRDGMEGEGGDRRRYELWCWALQERLQENGPSTEKSTKCFDDHCFEQNSPIVVDFKSDIKPEVYYSRQSDTHFLKAHKASMAHLTERLNRRRSRTNFSDQQLHTLENTFLQQHYPDLAVCERLSKELLLASSTIQVSTALMMFLFNAHLIIQLTLSIF